MFWASEEDRELIFDIAVAICCVLLGDTLQPLDESDCPGEVFCCWVVVLRIEGRCLGDKTVRGARGPRGAAPVDEIPGGGQQR